MIDNRTKKLLLPLILEQLLAVSVGMVDTFMVSTVGETAVSGVALADNINRLIIQIMSAFAAGGIVVVSQFIGSGKKEMSERACAHLQMLITFFCLLVMAAVLPFGRNILDFLFGNIDPEVMEASVIYLNVSVISLVFYGIYTAGAAILRCQENTKTSMKVSLTMNIVNVLFNAFFVFVMKMGVLGVGIATLISRMLAGIIMEGIILSPKNSLRISSPKMYIPSADMIKKILSIGVPNGIENGMFQIGKLLVVGLIATLGTSAIAANSIAFQIIDFPNIPGVAIGLALVVMVGQDIGAGEHKKAMEDTRNMIKLAFLGDRVCKLLLFFAAPPIAAVFNLSEAASNMAVVVLRWFVIASITVWPLSFTLPCALRGAGDAKYTMIVSILSMWICRIAVSFILVKVFELGLLGVWFGMFADWYVRAFFYYRRFKSEKWLNKKVI